MIDYELKCPKCGSSNIETTLVGIIALREPVKDTNDALCHACGLSGEAWEFGAPDAQPDPALAAMTDEEFGEWRKNLKIKEEVGICIINSNALADIYIKDEGD